MHDTQDAGVKEDRPRIEEIRQTEVLHAMFTRAIVTVLIAGAAFLAAVHVSDAALTTNGPSLNGLDVNTSAFSVNAVVVTLLDG
jgi:hypothetical protein